jgi:hypothetical protein
MPKSPRRRSSGDPKKASPENDGSRDLNSLVCSMQHVTCYICEGSYSLRITQGLDLELSCGCNGTKYTYRRV